MGLTGIRGCHWDSTIEGPLSELFLGKGLSVITPSRWKAVRGCLKEGYVQHRVSFYLFFLPLHQMSWPFSLSKSSAGFWYRHLQHRVLLTSRQKGRQDPHSEEHYRSKYGDEGSSQAHSYGAALTPALLLLLDPSGTGCSFSTVRGPAGQLHWILRIPAWQRGCREHQGTSASRSLINKKNRFPGYIGLCLWDFPYHVI